MKIINLTPHPIVVLGEEEIKILPSGEVLRLEEKISPCGEVNGIPVVEKALGGQGKLPPVKEGVFYIVSLPVAQAVKRQDFLVPDDLVRDGEGRVLGCRRFAVMA